MRQALQAVAAGALRRPPAPGPWPYRNLARGPRAMDHQARARVSDPLRLDPGPWAGGRCACCLAAAPGPPLPGSRTLDRCAWPVGPGPVAVATWWLLPGARSLGRGPRCLVRAPWCLDPCPRVETRHPIDRMPWPFFRFSRFWARVRSAEALARFRTENAALKSFRAISAFSMFHVKHSCQKYPFRCRIDSV